MVTVEDLLRFFHRPNVERHLVPSFRIRLDDRSSDDTISNDKSMTISFLLFVPHFLEERKKVEQRRKGEGGSLG